jgi:hypothetical protein
MTSLDAYCQEQGLTRVDFVKVDVEGAEMAVLRGAEQLLRRPSPPIWLIEMNISTSQNFGYSPCDLLRYLESFGDYRFARVVAGWGETLIMKSVADYFHGDNVLCVPAARWSRIEVLCDSRSRDNMRSTALDSA